MLSIPAVALKVWDCHAHPQWSVVSEDHLGSMLTYDCRTRVWTLSITQGRNKVRWQEASFWVSFVPPCSAIVGARSKFVPTCSNLRSFGSKCTVLKEVRVMLLEIFGPPCSHSAPHIDWATRNCAPLSHLVTPLQLPYPHRCLTLYSYWTIYSFDVSLSNTR